MINQFFLILEGKQLPFWNISHSKFEIIRSAKQVMYFYSAINVFLTEHKPLVGQNAGRFHHIRGLTRKKHLLAWLIKKKKLKGKTG